MTNERIVWDLPLRIFHWALVASVLFSWISGKVGYDLREYHMLAGYGMLGLLLFRLAWGFIGTRHSRFASFIPTPWSVVTYARDLINGTARQSIGHNPLGSLMVFVMLVVLLAQAVSGLFMDDDIMHAGPYADAVNKQTRRTMEDLHGLCANVIAVLALVHVLAVLYHQFKLKEPLIRAMITGRKSAQIVSQELSINTSALVRGVVVAVIVTGFVYWLIAINP